MSTVYVEGSRVIIAGRDLPDDFWSASQPRRWRKTASVLAVRIEYPAIVRTPEGDMTAEPGDYLVTDDPPTHAWPVRGEVFESTHAEVA